MLQPLIILIILIIAIMIFVIVMLLLHGQRGTMTECDIAGMDCVEYLFQAFCVILAPVELSNASPEAPFVIGLSQSVVQTIREGRPLLASQLRMTGDQFMFALSCVAYSGDQYPTDHLHLFTTTTTTTTAAAATAAADAAPSMKKNTLFSLAEFTKALLKMDAHFIPELKSRDTATRCFSFSDKFRKSYLNSLMDRLQNEQGINAFLPGIDDQAGFSLYSCSGFFMEYRLPLKRIFFYFSDVVKSVLHAEWIDTDAVIASHRKVCLQDFLAFGRQFGITPWWHSEHALALVFAKCNNLHRSENNVGLIDFQEFVEGLVRIGASIRESGYDATQISDRLAWFRERIERNYERLFGISMAKDKSIMDHSVAFDYDHVQFELRAEAEDLWVPAEDFGLSRGVNLVTLLGQRRARDAASNQWFRKLFFVYSDLQESSKVVMAQSGWTQFGLDFGLVVCRDMWARFFSEHCCPETRRLEMSDFCLAVLHMTQVLKSFFRSSSTTGSVPNSVRRKEEAGSGGDSSDRPMLPKNTSVDKDPPVLQLSRKKSLVEKSSLGGATLSSRPSPRIITLHKPVAANQAAEEEENRNDPLVKRFPELEVFLNRLTSKENRDLLERVLAQRSSLASSSTNIVGAVKDTVSAFLDMEVATIPRRKQRVFDIYLGHTLAASVCDVPGKIVPFQFVGNLKDLPSSPYCTLIVRHLFSGRSLMEMISSCESFDQYVTKILRQKYDLFFGDERGFDSTRIAHVIVKTLPPNPYLRVWRIMSADSRLLGSLRDSSGSFSSLAWQPVEMFRTNPAMAMTLYIDEPFPAFKILLTLYKTSSGIGEFRQLIAVHGIWLDPQMTYK
eukprot:ANDGO_03153.mRNA.1 hypothetical protein